MIGHRTLAYLGYITVKIDIWMFWSEPEKECLSSLFSQLEWLTLFAKYPAKVEELQFMTSDFKGIPSELMIAIN